MLTKKRWHPLEAEIFKSLQTAGWVAEGVFSEENGWRVVWTELGTRRVRRLREVIAEDCEVFVRMVRDRRGE